MNKINQVIMKNIELKISIVNIDKIFNLLKEIKASDK
jgi:hypothetical protein